MTSDSAASEAAGESLAVDHAAEDSGTFLDHELALDCLLVRLGVSEEDLEEYDTHEAALKSFTDKELAGAVWRSVKASGFEVRQLKESGELWCYYTDTGVWVPEGELLLKQLARRALTDATFGKNVIRELTAEAEADPDILVEADTFGLPPGYVLLENGILDLEAAASGAGTDAIREPTPEDLALRQLPVAYDPTLSYDQWAAYVEEWAEEGRADTLQEFVGYCLHAGGLPFHRALLLVGEGRNGKSTFLNVVRAVLGKENTTSIDLQTLAREKFARSKFYRSLANIDDDLSSADLGAGGLGMFKKLVAGDPVYAEKKHQPGFMFTPTGKHLYAANTVPDVNVADDDVAFWERWEVVEFPNYYSPENRDPDLKDRLTEPEHLSRVLNWAIDGWGRLMDTDRFTNELDTWDKRAYWQRYGETTDQFIHECTNRDDDADNIAAGEVYAIYQAWCRQHDETPEKQHALTGKLKSAGFTYKESVRIGDRTPRGFTDLAITDQAPEIDDTPETDDQQERLGE